MASHAFSTAFQSHDVHDSRVLKYSTITFLVSGWIILACTAILKLVSASMEIDIHGQSSPLFEFLTNRQLLLIAAVLELIVCFAMIRKAAMSCVEKLGIIAWIASIFHFYRIGLYLIGFKGQCSCLGNAAHWLGTTPDKLDIYAGWILAYLLLGSISLLVAHYLRSSRNTSLRSSSHALFLFIVFTVRALPENANASTTRFSVLTNHVLNPPHVYAFDFQRTYPTGPKPADIRTDFYSVKRSGEKFRVLQVMDAEQFSLDFPTNLMAAYGYDGSTYWQFIPGSGLRVYTRTLESASNIFDITNSVYGNCMTSLRRSEPAFTFGLPYITGLDSRYLNYHGSRNNTFDRDHWKSAIEFSETRVVITNYVHGIKRYGGSFTLSSNSTPVDLRFSAVDANAEIQHSFRYEYSENPEDMFPWRMIHTIISNGKSSSHVEDYIMTRLEVSDAPLPPSLFDFSSLVSAVRSNGNIHVNPYVYHYTNQNVYIVVDGQLTPVVSIPAEEAPGLMMRYGVQIGIVIAMIAPFGIYIFTRAKE